MTLSEHALEKPPKKVIFLMVRPLRLRLKFIIFFSLNCRLFIPPPILLARQLKKK